MVATQASMDILYMFMTRAIALWKSMKGGALPQAPCPELRSSQGANKWSRHFLGVSQTVKECTGGTIYSTTGDQEVWLSLCAWINSQGSIMNGQAVKAINFFNGQLS